MIFSDATSAAYRRTGSLAYWLTGALVLLPGCQEERRVPYIPPTLHNWQQPYRGQKGLRLHVFHVGTLRPRGGILTRPGDTTPAPERAVVAYVLQHPQHGLIVLNTGLSHHLAEDAKDYLGRLQAMLLDVELETGQDLPSQMRAAKMEPKAVRWVVLSNLQFPHTGEAEGFPEAVRVVSRAEYEHAKGGGAGYIAREFDDISNWQLVDFSDGHPLGTMPAAIDLFEDGSVMLLDAQGPTEGNLAILVRLPSRPGHPGGRPRATIDDSTLRCGTVWDPRPRCLVGSHLATEALPGPGRRFAGGTGQRSDSAFQRDAARDP